MKKTQLFMVWLLPLIVIGGIFYPLLGYLVIGMMAFLLVLAFFRGRYWCWNLCPRGAFLDISLQGISRNRPVPGIFLKQWFRWLVFIFFLSFMALRILRTGGNPVAIAAVFVSICLLTTLIAVVLGIATRHRSWCVICPMGTLQAVIAKKKKGGI